VSRVADPPALVKISVAARVLGVDERTVRGWVEAGRMDIFQFRPGSMRYVRAEELNRFAARIGLETRWGEAL